MNLPDRTRDAIERSSLKQFDARAIAVRLGGGVTTQRVCAVLCYLVKRGELLRIECARHRVAFRTTERFSGRRPIAPAAAQADMLAAMNRLGAALRPGRRP